MDRRLDLPYLRHNVKRLEVWIFYTTRSRFLCKRLAMDRIAKVGMVRLLERCEGILRDACEDFVVEDWRNLCLEKVPYKPVKPRWRDSAIAWTGLRPEEIDDEQYGRFPTRKRCEHHKLQSDRHFWSPDEPHAEDVINKARARGQLPPVEVSRVCDPSRSSPSLDSGVDCNGDEESSSIWDIEDVGMADDGLGTSSLWVSKLHVF